MAASPACSCESSGKSRTGTENVASTYLDVGRVVIIPDVVLVEGVCDIKINGVDLVTKIPSLPTGSQLHWFILFVCQALSIFPVILFDSET